MSSILQLKAWTCSLLLRRKVYIGRKDGPVLGNPVKRSFEIVEDDGICEAFKDEGELPKWVDRAGLENRRD